MRNFIFRILSILKRVGAIEDTCTISYQGKGVSVNEYYSAKGWWNRAKIKKEYSAIFEKLIKKSNIQWMNTYALIIYYNSNHDPDNVVGLSKIFVDEIKQEKIKKSGVISKKGYITDDSPRYCKFFAIVPDRELVKNTFEFNLIKIN